MFKKKKKQHSCWSLIYCMLYFNCINWKGNWGHIKYSSCSAKHSLMFSSAGYTDQQHPESLYHCDGLTSPRQTASSWAGQGGDSGSLYGHTGTARVSPDYGTKYWMGHERKRSGEAAGLIASGEELSITRTRASIFWAKDLAKTVDLPSCRSAYNNPLTL